MMSIDHLQSDSLSLPQTRFFRPSHRTRPEQGIGLLVFFFLSMGIALFVNDWILYHTILPLSIWTLWRRYSLRTLKVELSIYLSQFAFEICWFLTQETLLSLVALLLLWCTQLLLILLFWKKERISGLLLIPPAIWVFYITMINMATCISTP